MTSLNVRDYGDSGMTIQDAMNDHATRFPDKKARPNFLLWNGVRIWTSDSIAVSQRGIVRAEFLFAKRDVEQGFDIKVNGWIELSGGEHVPHLRAWYDDKLEGVVEYPFFSRDERLWVWNVYKMKYPGGQTVEEKWTENAGFWVEQVSKDVRIYHCSHGMAARPDFESLLFRVSIR